MYCIRVSFISPLFILSIISLAVQVQHIFLFIRCTVYSLYNFLSCSAVAYQTHDVVYIRGKVYTDFFSDSNSLSPWLCPHARRTLAGWLVGRPVKRLAYEQLNNLECLV